MQARLKANTQGERVSRTARLPSLLAGRVVDEDGKPLVASHACKGKPRYRYYVSRSLQHQDDGDGRRWRIAAFGLERTVCTAVAHQLKQPLGMVGNLMPDHLDDLPRRASELADRNAKRQRAAVRQLVERVRVQPAIITVDLNATELASRLGQASTGDGPATIAITIPVQLKRSGRSVNLVQPDGRAAAPSQPQQHLVKLILQTRALWNEMLEEGLTPAALARKQGLSSSRTSRLTRLNFLAPDIIDAIATGTQPTSLDAQSLLDLKDLPLDWSQQRQRLRL